MSDTRAVSVALSYTFAIAISVTLATGLVVAVGDQVDRRHGTVAREQLEVVGGRLATGLGMADRLATERADRVAVTVSLPARVAGSPYQVVVDAGPSTSALRLAAPRAGANVTVRFVNRTAVAETRVNGGDLVVVLTPAGALEVRPA